LKHINVNTVFIDGEREHMVYKYA